MIAEVCSPLGLLMGTQVEVVGLEDGPDDVLRVFFTHRADGTYVEVGPEHLDEQAAIREAWLNVHSRLLIPAPQPDQVQVEVRPRDGER